MRPSRRRTVITLRVQTGAVGRVSPPTQERPKPPGSWAGTGPLLYSVRYQISPLPLGRRLGGWALVLAGLPMLTAVLAGLRSNVTLSSDLLIYLVLVVVVATIG